MVNLVELILHLHPNATPRKDFTVSDDGHGPKITHWDEAVLGPQPTPAQLETHRAAAEAALESRRQKEATETANQTALETNLEGGLGQLRAYVALASPTVAQTAAVVKVLCRLLIALARLRLRKLDATS